MAAGDRDVQLDAAKIDKLIAALPERGRRLVRSLAENIVTGTKRRAPVKTGRLRASYAAVPVATDAAALSIDVGTNVEYAPFVELGTSHMVAQPHLQPAVEDARAQLPVLTAELFVV